MAENTEPFEGTEASEVIVGTERGDRIRARGGDDLVMGSAGEDDLRGDQGNDVIFGGSGDDAVRGNQGDDVIFGGSGDDTVRGGQGDDVIFGGSGGDTVRGGRGDDVLFGGSGDDTLTGGSGADTFVFYPNDGNDEITDFDVNEDTIDLTGFGANIEFSQLTFTATEDGSGTIIDLAAFGGGQITVHGVNPDEFTEDMFNLPDGATSADQGNGYILGTTGNDVVIVGEGDSVIATFQGDDVVIGGEGRDAISGGEGNDWLQGNEGDDTIFGNRGDDVIFGGEGDDRLEGGAGRNFLHGGAGADTFVFGPSAGDNTIADFTDGEDLIDLSAITGISGFDDLPITADGNAAVIDLTQYGGGTIRLENVDVADLEAADFLFYESPEQPMDGG